MESFIIECGGLVITAIFAMINGNRKQSCIVAVIFMSIINILSQIIIAGGGPTACVGAFVMPLLGIIAVLLTIGLKNMISKKNISKAEDIVVSKRKNNS